MIQRMYSLAWVFALISQSVWASSFTAELDKNNGTLDDEFILTLTIEGSFDDDPVVPEIDGLEIYEGGRSQNVSIVNGSYSKNVSQSYILRPKRMGTFEIPSLSLTVDDKPLKTVPLKMIIQKAPAVDPAEDQPLIYVERVLEKTDVYVGETVPAKVRVYFRVKLTGGNPEDHDSRDFRYFRIEGENKYVRMIGGQKYQVIEIDEVWVPQKSGQLKIPAFVLNANLLIPQKRQRQQRRRGVFDQFFDDPFFNRGRQIKKRVRSDELAVNVKELPANPSSHHFSGLVGEFSLKSELSHQQVKVGDTTTLTLTLTGEGVIDGMVDPQPVFDDRFKVYADKPQFEQKAERGLGVIASKTFKYALVPTQNGDIPLTPIEITIFNTKKKEYQVLQTPALNIMAQGGADNSDVGVAGGLAQSVLQKRVEVLGDDLIGWHRSVDPENSHELTTTDFYVFGFSLGSATLFLLGGFVQSRRQNFWGNQKKRRRALAYKNYQQAVRDISQPEQVAAALRGYVGDRLNIHGGALTAKDVAQPLTDAQFTSDQVAAATGLLKELEDLAYSGRSPTVQQIDQFRERCDRVVKDLETGGKA